MDFKMMLWYYLYPYTCYLPVVFPFQSKAESYNEWIVLTSSSRLHLYYPVVTISLACHPHISSTLSSPIERVLSPPEPFHQQLFHTLHLNHFHTSPQLSPSLYPLSPSLPPSSFLLYMYLSLFSILSQPSSFLYHLSSLLPIPQCANQITLFATISV